MEVNETDNSISHFPIPSFSTITYIIIETRRKKKSSNESKIPQHNPTPNQRIAQNNNKPPSASIPIQIQNHPHIKRIIISTRSTPSTSSFADNPHHGQQKGELEVSQRKRAPPGVFVRYRLAAGASAPPRRRRPSACAPSPAPSAYVTGVRPSPPGCVPLSSWILDLVLELGFRFRIGSFLIVFFYEV